MNRSNDLAVAELDALLDDISEPDPQQSSWVAAVCAAGDVADLCDDEVCEIAAERDERGPRATIDGLIDGLRVRPVRDRVTLARLATLQDFHVPDFK